MADAKTMTVLNQGQRPIITSKGPLVSNGSLELPVEEAKKLLVYKGVVDAEKVVPGMTKLAGRALRKENERLRKENEELKKGKGSKKSDKDDEDAEKNKKKEQGGQE